MSEPSAESIAAELAASFDHLDPRLTNEVLYAVYDRLNAGTCPVPHTAAHGGFSLIIRYDDLNEVEKNFTAFSSAKGVLHPAHEGRSPSIPIEYDPPQHTNYRPLFMEVLSAPRVRAFEPTLRKLIDKTLDDFAVGSDSNFADRVAMQIPIQAVVQLLGVDPEIGREFQVYGEQILHTFGTSAMVEAFTNFGKLVNSEIEARRTAPRSDYLTSLIKAKVDGQPITDAELLNTLQSFVFAGFETTARLMATMVHHLAVNPELQDRLRREPELIANVAEESLRYFASVHTMFRTATRPVEVNGTQIEEGGKVALMYAVANRDATAFESPNEFQPDRSNARRHLAFGAGPHFCAGAPLARAELRLLLEALAARPNYELAGEVQHLPKLMMGQIMGVNVLPVRFTK